MAQSEVARENEKWHDSSTTNSENIEEQYKSDKEIGEDAHKDKDDSNDSSAKTNEEPASFFSTSVRKKERMNACLLINDLAEQVEVTKKRYHTLRKVKIALLVIFMIVWLLIIPMLLEHYEDWTYQASWYYSVQAGFGIGYGAISPSTQGIDIFLTVHLFLGSLFIAFLVSTYVTNIIESEDGEKESSTRNIGKQLLGQRELGWIPFFYCVGLYFIVIVMGILYGVLREKWNFTESLLFIISTCQTSGLVAPDIKPQKEDAIFNPLFVMLLVILGVPLWAYGVGKLSVIFVYIESNRKNLITVMDRQREARATFLRIERRIKNRKDEKNDCESNEANSMKEYMDTHYGLSRSDFLVFWMLEQQLLDERTILDLMAEYDVMKMSEGSESHSSSAQIEREYDNVDVKDNEFQSMEKVESVPMWKVNTRLQFLQLVELKLVDEDAWPEFLETMERVKKSTIQKQ